MHGVRHTTSARYHPSSNGSAEHAVQIVKKGLRKVTQGSIQSPLAKILFMYQFTPQSITNVSLSELLLGLLVSVGSNGGTEGMHVLSDNSPLGLVGCARVLDDGWGLSTPMLFLAGEGVWSFLFSFDSEWVDVGVSTWRW